MPGKLAADISGRLLEGERILHSSAKVCRISVGLALPLRGGGRIIAMGTRNSDPNQALVTALRRAHGMVDYHRGLPSLTAAPASRYHRDTLSLAFLAPDIQRDILAGRQPSNLSLETLRHLEIPLCWKRQREVLGWPDRT